jgi:hypothetical protein
MLIEWLTPWSLLEESFGLAIVWTAHLSRTHAFRSGLFTFGPELVTSGAELVIFGSEPAVFGRLLPVHASFPNLHTVLAHLPEIRAMIALVCVKENDNCDAADYVQPFTLPIDEYRRQQMVVDKEHYEEYCILLPYSKYFLPIELDICVGRTNGKTHYWCYEQ